jgi:hypothetical protein
LIFDFQSTFGVQNQFSNATIISWFASFYLILIIQFLSLLYRLTRFIHESTYTYVFRYINRWYFVILFVSVMIPLSDNDYQINMYLVILFRTTSLLLIFQGYRIQNRVIQSYSFVFTMKQILSELKFNFLLFLVFSYYLSPTINGVHQSSPEYTTYLISLFFN